MEIPFPQGAEAWPFTPYVWAVLVMSFQRDQCGRGGGSTVEEPNKHDLSQVIKVNIDTDNYIDVMLPLIYGEKET